MKKRRNHVTILLSGTAMILLLCNAKLSLVYASGAINLCVSSLIPSLFPFMFLAVLLNGALCGVEFSFLRIIGKICRIPIGGEILFLLGILGGYPVGAQVISNTYQTGNLHKNDAERMLAFCNNAGPSFIFGIIGPLFQSIKIPVLLWCIQIASALITAVLLRCSSGKSVTIRNQNQISITDSLEKSVKTMGLICGWVILFRIIVGFVERTLMSYLPSCAITILTGFLELTNGCIRLYSIENLGLRFIFASGFLSLGGLCVALQTASATAGLDLKLYFIGKCIQTAISVLFALLLQSFIFQQQDRFINLTVPGQIAMFSLLGISLFVLCKKVVAIPNKVIYN